MILAIHDGLFIEDVQDRFSECFPKLKIEFFTEQPYTRSQVKAGELISPKQKIADVRKLHNRGLFEIKSWDSANRVEVEIRNVFGLNVQLFKLLNNHWVPVANGENATLKQLSGYTTDPINHAAVPA